VGDSEGDELATELAEWHADRVGWPEVVVREE
jgi:hypothetical protein